MSGKITQKSWGYEELIYNEEYCCKLLVYTEEGKASSLHHHQQKHETFVVTSGRFEIEVNGVKYLSEKGNYFVLPPGTKHRIRCLKMGVIVESSSHDDPEDCVREIPSDA